MARLILYGFILIGFIISIAKFFMGDGLDTEFKMMILSTLCVLAICEAIVDNGKKR